MHSAFCCMVLQYKCQVCVTTIPTVPFRPSEKPADQSHCQPNTPADDMKVSLLMDPHPQSGDTTDTGKHKIQDNAEFGKCERQHCQICEECDFSYMQD